MLKKLGLKIGILISFAIILGSIAVFYFAAQSQGPSEADTEGNGLVNIYTARHYGVEEVFEAFTRETGIAVRFTTGSDAILRERIKAEGRHTPADMYIAVDAGSLWLAAQDGLLSPVESAVLADNLPQNLRDPENRWFGLTKRVRTIMYHPDRVSPDELSTYEALTDSKWNERLLMRPATHVYTQSLVSSLIAAHGRERAGEIVSGWTGNSLTLIDSDTRILETLAAGGGDVAITNHYYLGRLLEADPNFPARVFWANQGDGERGAHINISGAGITAHAPNRDNAVVLLEWLSSPQGQKIFADSNHEFPANPIVEPHPIIAGFGDFIADPIDLGELGRLQAEASKVLDEAGYR